MNTAQLFIRGSWVDGESTKDVADKYTGEPATLMHVASHEQVLRATRDLDEAYRTEALAPYQRFRVLARAAELLRERNEAFVDAIVTDTGFTLVDAQREVDRAAETLLLSGEEAKRVTGEMIPVSASPDGNDRIGFTLRAPLGVVCAITPFNSPLNTVVHKLAPALAAGNAVVLKPAATTPFTAVRLVELLLDAGLPPRLIALVNGPGSSVGQWLLEDRAPAFYAFTGSTEVGLHIRRAIGLRPSQLEMGSLSSTIVCADADLSLAASKSVNATFRKAGQVCTSIQRLYVHRSVAGELGQRLAELVAARPAGDPREQDTFVGPVISPKDAERIESWVSAAIAGGAEVVAGAGRRGNVISPTVLSHVTPSMAVMRKEVFGPIVSLCLFDDLGTAIEEVNNTPYGLSAGIFTAGLDTALDAARQLRMGSVHINETSSSRVDLQPYGGVKASGLGIEGPKYAIREMTEQRLVTIGHSH